MNQIDLPDRLFLKARAIPTELSLDRVTTMVNAMPVAAGLVWWKLLINPKSITMLTLTTAIVGTIMILSPADPPTNEASLSELPVIINLLDEPADTMESESTDTNTTLPDTIEEVRIPEESKSFTPSSLMVETLTVRSVVETPTVTPTTSPIPDPVPVKNATPPAPEPAPACCEVKEFDITGFHSIQANAAVDIQVKQGPFAVSAEGDMEVINELELSVKDNALVIEFAKKKMDKKQRKKKDCLINVQMPDLNALQLNGYGDMTIGSFQCKNGLHLDVNGFGDLNFTDKLTVKGETKIDITGYGDVRMAGSTERLNIFISGFGDVHAADFRSRACEVRISGFGDAKVHAEDSLSIHASGFGDVSYSGSPSEVSKTVRGFSDVRAR